LEDAHPANGSVIRRHSTANLAAESAVLARNRLSAQTTTMRPVPVVVRPVLAPDLDVVSQTQAAVHGPSLRRGTQRVCAGGPAAELALPLPPNCGQQAQCAPCRRLPPVTLRRPPLGAIRRVVDGCQAARHLDGNDLAHPGRTHDRPRLAVGKQGLQHPGVEAMPAFD